MAFPINQVKFSAGLITFIFIFCFEVHAVEQGFVELLPEFSPGFEPNLANTEGGIWMIVSDAEEAIKHSPAKINDSNLNNYLNNVICKLSEDYCQDIRLHIIRKPYFNASMAPNGMMQVWSGLLLRMRNEAQLATVLGHEIGHYLKKHSLKNFNDIKLKANLFTFFTLGIAGTVAAGHLNSTVGRSIVDITQFGVLASIFAHNRSSEREADKFGIQLLQDANLDINEAPKIWQNIIDEQEAGDDSFNPISIFFATHPDPGERVNNLQNHITKISDTENISIDKNKDQYWNALRPFMNMLLEDEINLNQFEQSEFLLKSLITDQIELGTVHYHLGELYRLRKNEGDNQLALEHYKKSLQFGNVPHEVHRSLGLIHYKSKDKNSADKEFKKYLELTPDANDKEMIEFYINFGG